MRSETEEVNLKHRVFATCATFSSKQEEEKASERGVSKRVEWQEAPGAGFSDGQTGRPATQTQR